MKPYFVCDVIATSVRETPQTALQLNTSDSQVLRVLQIRIRFLQNSNNAKILINSILPLVRQC